MTSQRAAASWRSVEAFCAVARRGSVIAVAGDLGVTASALSYLVQVLEARLGVALLERSGRGVALTDEGAALAAAGMDGVDVAHGTVLETRNLAIQAAIGQMDVLVIDPQHIAAEVAAGQLVVPFGPAVAMDSACWLVARPGQGGRPYTAFRRWILAQACAGAA